MATNPRQIDELTQQIADEIRRQREKRRWRQDELSELSGVPQGTLSRMERGLVAIDLSQLGRLARAFGLTARGLMDVAAENAGQVQDAPLAQVYLPDGSFNPASTRGFEESDDHIAALLARDEDAAG